MIKYLISMVILFMFAGTALSTMWLYDDPSFLQMGTGFSAPMFKPGSVSPLEIVNAPYFPLLGQSFYTDAMPVQIRNSSNVIEIGSMGKLNSAPTQITFGEHLEDNLRYAQTKSSLRVGQQGSWTTLNVPGAK
jgi:hypothetical protein